MSMGILGGPSAIGTMTTDLFDWLSPGDDEPMPVMQKAGTPLPTASHTTDSGGGTAMQWKVKSADTLAFQNAVNAALKAKGKPTITADGVLGPGTCAAAKYVGMDPGSVCQSYGTYPPAGGGVAISTPVTSSAAAAMYSPPSKSNALLIGAAVGGLALVGLVVAKKKGWIK
jgi:hypothetical protein